MGKIIELKEKDLIGRLGEEKVYPVTSTLAVYNQENVVLEDILKYDTIHNISLLYQNSKVLIPQDLSSAIEAVPSRDRVPNFLASYLDLRHNYNIIQFVSNDIKNWNNTKYWKNLSAKNLNTQISNLCYVDSGEKLLKLDTTNKRLTVNQIETIISYGIGIEHEVYNVPTSYSITAPETATLFWIVFNKESKVFDLVTPENLPEEDLLIIATGNFALTSDDITIGKNVITYTTSRIKVNDIIVEPIHIMGAESLTIEDLKEVVKEVTEESGITKGKVYIVTEDNKNRFLQKASYTYNGSSVPYSNEYTLYIPNDADVIIIDTEEVYRILNTQSVDAATMVITNDFEAGRIISLSGKYEPIPENCKNDNDHENTNYFSNYIYSYRHLGGGYHEDTFEQFLFFKNKWYSQL